MSRLLDFNAGSWERSDALVLLFFSDWPEVRNDRKYRSKLKKRVTDQILNHATKITLEPQEDDEFVRSTIEKLAEISSALRTTEYASPLIWIRFAFTALRSSISPAEYFLNQYARWRYKRSRDYPGETIVRLVSSVNTLKKPRTVNVSGQELQGYLLDEYFLRKTVAANLGCRSEWGFSPARVLKEIGPTKHKIEDVVGKIALRKISECIIDAVKFKKISGLNENKTNGRFESNISRANLAKALLKKFKEELPYRQSTVIRCLTEFVACPNHRINRR